MRRSDDFQLSRQPGSCIPREIGMRAAYGFLRWKGRRARELGCTILIDDVADWVVTGCRENGVAFLDANVELVG